MLVNIDNEKEFDIKDVSVDKSKNEFWNLKYNENDLNIYSNTIFSIQKVNDTHIFIDITDTDLFKIINLIDNFFIDSFFNNQNYYFYKTQNLMKIKINPDTICHNKDYKYINFNKNLLVHGAKIKIGIKSIGPWFINSEDQKTRTGISWQLTNLQLI
jgi:hypothetical protein